MHTDLPKLLRFNDVAERLNIPARTLQDWRFRGIGPRSKRIGNRVYYRESDVQEWLDQQFADTEAPTNTGRSGAA